MIVDVHVHLTVPGFVKGKFLVGNARAGAATYNRINGTHFTPDDYIDMLKKTSDPDSSKLVATMDEAGIDKAVIFGVDWAYGVTGEPRVSNAEQNKWHAEVCKKYPGRFIALAAIDPRRPDCLDQAKQCIEEYGCRGFKLMPAAGWYPTDRVAFPLYEKAAELKVPILFHSGGGEFNWEYSQPMYIASVAERFPEINMVMAHAGNESWEAAKYAAGSIPNVFLDISTWQRAYRVNAEGFYRWLRDLIDWCGPHKILFATDAPMPNFWVSMVDWVKAIKEPASQATQFTQLEIDMVMGKAAQDVFNLE